MTLKELYDFLKENEWESIDDIRNTLNACEEKYKKQCKEIEQLKSQIEYWQAQTMTNAGFTGEQFRMIQTAIASDIKDKLVACCRYDLDSEGNCDIVIDEPNFIGIFQDYGVDE